MRKFSILLGLVLFLCFPLSTLAQVDCNNLPHWVTLNNNIRFNQTHVFCGEYSNNKPKGFHARPGGVNPSTVAGFTIQDRANAAGIYTGKWGYTGHASQTKFSSMYPDACSQSQVLNSIAYASSHPVSCPSGAPSWVQCGNNRPDPLNGDTVDYCNKQEDLFTIGYAPPRNNEINTAFPLR
ncbi:MAG: EndoU domain-containing protein [Gammaproteobacteria bacterium]